MQMPPPVVTAMAIIATAGLSACAAGQVISPIEVTRFHQTSALPQLGAGTIFIQSGSYSDGGKGDDTSGGSGLEARTGATDILAYKAALADALTRLGYREAARSDAAQIAQISVTRYIDQPEHKQNPVRLGVGGATGSYGSGLGMGVGISLGGGQREMHGTDISVRIRNAASNEVLWEGRANFAASDNSPFASGAANASAMTEALFREFPGNNGETVEVRAEN